MHWLTSFFLAALITTAQAEVLSEVERASILKKLETVLASSAEQLNKRQGSAYSAYQKGLQSDSAALNLYLSCVELTQFKQRGLREADFRDWKRNNNDLLSESGYKRALRHQLNWLVLSIEASVVDPKKLEDRKKVQLSASKRLTELYQDAENLTSKNNNFNNQIQDELAKNVFSSAFAKAYGFNTLNMTGWPKSSIKLDFGQPAEDQPKKELQDQGKWPDNPKDTPNIFQKLIFPVYREQGNNESLRKAWSQMIMFHEISLQSWSQESKYSGRSTKDLPTPDLLGFQRDKKPNIIWQMETDLFEQGDQRRATANMFQHIEDNLFDNQAASWTQQLVSLLSPKE